MTEKTRNLAYWGTTALVCAAMGGGGVLDLMKAEDVMKSLERLGYPDYLATILGVAKLLGVVAILAPGFRRLKEWAYAGMVIDLIGAFVSHLAVGDPVKDLAPPLVVLVLTFASWWLRPASRRLP